LVSPDLSTLAAGHPAVSSRGFNCLSDAQSVSSGEEIESTMGASQSDVDDLESELEKQGPFTFRRKRHCNYLAVSLIGFKQLSLMIILTLWNEFKICYLLKPTQVSSSNACYDPNDSGFVDPRLRFCLTSLPSPNPRCIGFSRRRFGRGGRYFLLFANLSSLSIF
jgi:hypothetical protein